MMAWYRRVPGNCGGRPETPATPGTLRPAPRDKAVLGMTMMAGAERVRVRPFVSGTSPQVPLGLAASRVTSGLPTKRAAVDLRLIHSPREGRRGTGDCQPAGRWGC